VGAVRQVSSQLGRIIELVQQVTPGFEKVHIGMEAQAQGAEQIRAAMGQLSESTQQTAEALRENSGAITQLNESARDLQQRFTRFRMGENGVGPARAD
jgi:methyl-accepting chemotaxis protein WspA